MTSNALTVSMYSIPYCISIDMFRIHLFYEICGVVLMSVGHVKNVLLIEYSSGQHLEDLDVPIICYVQAGYIQLIVCRPLHVTMTASYRLIIIIQMFRMFIACDIHGEVYNIYLLYMQLHDVWCVYAQPMHLCICFTRTLIVRLDWNQIYMQCIWDQCTWLIFYHC